MDELTAIWRATGGNGDHDKIVRLLLLTGQRREEIGGLLWSEINFDRAQIELPAERTKNKRPHTIPLSAQALQILRSVEVHLNRDFVFGRGQGPYSGWSRSKLGLDSRLGKAVAPWRLHDLRRSFVSHCADLEFGSVLAIEAAVNHLSGERAGIRGIYNRGTQERQKRELMDRWGQHIETLTAKVDNNKPAPAEPQADGRERRQALAYLNSIGKRPRSRTSRRRIA